VSIIGEEEEKDIPLNRRVAIDLAVDFLKLLVSARGRGGRNQLVCLARPLVLEQVFRGKGTGKEKRKRKKLR